MEDTLANTSYEETTVYFSNTTECGDNDYGCWSDERFIKEINDYIFPKVYEWIFIVLNILVFIFGLGGNFLVCFAVYRNKHLQSVTNYFLVNLAVADFMVVLICLPPTLVHDIAQTWFLGIVMCKLIMYLQVGIILFYLCIFTAMPFDILRRLEVINFSEFIRIHRNSPTLRKDGKPRTITGKLVNLEKKKAEILKAQKEKRDAGNELPFNITPQSPNEIVECRKQLLDINKSYHEQNIKTRVVGEKLLFPDNSLYRDKVSTPTAEDILTQDEKETDKLNKISLTTSNTVVEAGNKFIGNAAKVGSLNDVRKSYKKVVTTPGHTDAHHNILVYRYVDNSGNIQKGYQDDGEFGAGRKLLKYLETNDISNTAFIISRWSSGNHIGPKRFSLMEKIVEKLNVSVLVSALTLTAISIERFLAICHPLSHRVSKFKTRLAVFLIWMISLSAAAPNLWFLTLHPDPMVPQHITILLTSCKPLDDLDELKFFLFLSIAFFFFPVLIMGYTYFRISRCLWTSTTAGPARINSTSQGALHNIRARKRTAKMLIVVVLVFIACYLPVYLLNILRYVGVIGSVTNHDVVMIIALTSHWLCYYNSSVNPIIYNFMSEKNSR
ncbi:hypothetical protein KUTeg_016710 [Tegillarca granosa]|uniref:G-protein coupled receptors family 1 profile domain-containing protein n=1 Tax=Tegillarca granosa TaxID=220873 RepID=A0ABQ9ERZ2_TEGGR|nr:hypothetical protein KUTeg_016710 [Tegillarca granosa]